jgi:hypothetical protein
VRPLKAQTQAKVLYGEPETILEGAQKRKFKRALKRQQSLQHEGKAVGAPFIHDDRLYTGWSDGLGCNLQGRAHRREMMAQRGREHGTGKLRECG